MSFVLTATTVGMTLVAAGFGGGGKGQPNAIGAESRPAIAWNAASWRRELTGTVNDREGNPLQGVVVFTRGHNATVISATSDENGRFAIGLDRSAAAFLFFRKPGFRFSGVPLAESGDPMTITLVRRTEPPDRVLKSLTIDLPREDAVQLAKKLVWEKLLEDLKSENDDVRYAACVEVSAFDPLQALAVIESRGFSNPWFNDAVRSYVERELLKLGLVDDALSVVASMEAESWKVTGYLDVFDVTDAKDKSRRDELITRTSFHARQVPEPEMRVIGLCKVADRQKEMGNDAEGRELILGMVTEVAALSSNEMEGYAKAFYAARLAPYDLQKAWSMATAIESEIPHRWENMVLRRIARTDPESAERLLAEQKIPKGLYNATTTAVCYQLAPQDLARAIRIAESTDLLDRRAHALATIALAIHRDNPTRAIELLDTAYQTLSAHAASDDVRDCLRAAEWGGYILPIVERIDPGLLNEFLWETVAFVPQQMRVSSTSPRDAVDSFGEAVLAVSRYDQDMAALLLEPLSEELSDYVQSESGISVPGMNRALQAWVIVDPSKAFEAVENAANNSRSPVVQRRSRELASLLACRPEDLWHKLYRTRTSLDFEGDEL